MNLFCGSVDYLKSMTIILFPNRFRVTYAMETSNVFSIHIIQILLVCFIRSLIKKWRAKTADGNILYSVNCIFTPSSIYFSAYQYIADTSDE